MKLMLLVTHCFRTAYTTSTVNVINVCRFVISRHQHATVQNVATVTRGYLRRPYASASVCAAVFPVSPAMLLITVGIFPPAIVRISLVACGGDFKPPHFASARVRSPDCRRGGTTVRFPFRTVSFPRPVRYAFLSASSIRPAMRLCVSYIKALFVPVDIQHTRYPCRFFNPTTESYKLSL